MCVLSAMKYTGNETCLCRDGATTSSGSRKSTTACPGGRYSKLHPRPAPRQGWKRRNYGGPPSFTASFSKLRLFLSKDFQRKLWRFCEIPKGYKRSKPKRSTSKFFRRAGPFFDTFPTS